MRDSGQTGGSLLMVHGGAVTMCTGRAPICPVAAGLTALAYVIGGSGTLRCELDEMPIGAKTVVLNSGRISPELVCAGRVTLLTLWGTRGEASELPDTWLILRPTEELVRALESVRACLEADPPRLPDERALDKLLLDIQAHANDLDGLKQALPRYLRKVRQILDTIPHEALTLDQLAGEARVSKYKLIKDFKKQWGVTPIDYLVKKRLEIGARLLSETETSIEAISEVSGFSSVPYFTTCFKKHYELTPYAYRQQCRSLHRTT